MTKTVDRFILLGLIAIGLYFGIQLAQFPIFYFLQQNGERTLTEWQAAVSIGGYLVLIAVTIAVGIKTKVIDFKNQLNGKYLVVVLVIGEVAIIALSMVGAIVKLMMGDDAVAANQAIINELMGSLPLSLMFIMVVFGAPIIEEAIFRGFVPEMFPEKWRWVGLLIGAILFGLIHNPTDVGSAIQYIGMGGVFAVIRHFGKRTEYSMLLHAMHNGIVFAIMLSQLR